MRSAATPKGRSAVHSGISVAKDTYALPMRMLEGIEEALADFASSYAHLIIVT